MKNEYFDSLETRTSDDRLSALLGELPEQLAHAVSYAPAFQELYKGIDLTSIVSLEALQGLPVLRKEELLQRQHDMRPFGGFVGQWRGRVGRVFASPGPIYEPEGRNPDYWRTARAFFAAGFRAGDLVHNSFSYHMTPGAWVAESGANALGCTIFPAGSGQVEQQIQVMLDLKPDAYCGTPSFLKILLNKMDELGVEIPSLKKVMVSAEYFSPELRQALAVRGVGGFESYITADVGLIAYETTAHDGLVVDEKIIVEIVRPGTNETVPAGEVGEVVVTTFNRDYPLIRFGTGDLSAILPGTSSCGRTNIRIKGWMGRADQATKVKGVFVHPKQVADVVQRHPEIHKARLVVGSANGQDCMTLRCEGSGDRALSTAVIASLREITKLRGEMVFCSPGDLPNDGIVIEDTRSQAQTA